MAADKAAAPTRRELALRLAEPCRCCGRRATLREISLELGLSRQRVHQLLQERQA